MLINVLNIKFTHKQTYLRRGIAFRSTATYFCPMPCYNIHITGAVFKTGFRYYLKAKALSLGITGRVYYENKTSVGITASGMEEGLKSFVECCSLGNRFFRIDRIEVTEILPQEFSSFEVEDEIPDVVRMTANQQN